MAFIGKCIKKYAHFLAVFDERGRGGRGEKPRLQCAVSWDDVQQRLAQLDRIAGADSNRRHDPASRCEHLRRRLIAETGLVHCQVVQFPLYGGLLQVPFDRESLLPLPRFS